MSTAESIGIAAARDRGLRALFEDLGLDYYCEGDLSIEDAARSAGVDIVQLRGGMNRLPPSTGPNWPDRPLTELIAHLEKEHHTVGRDLIAHTAILFAEVCRGGCDERLTAMRDAFVRLSKILLDHIDGEEVIFFPVLLAFEEAWTTGAPPPGVITGGIRRLISKMMIEHFEISRQLRALREMRSAVADAPRGPLLTLLQCLGELERHLHEYINLENYVAFPRALALEDALYPTAPVAAR